MRDEALAERIRNGSASSEAEYSEKAAGLAADTRRLAEIKAALRDEMRASPLMDEVGFARAVEAS